jgi:PAS domain S-box-containing protein
MATASSDQKPADVSDVADLPFRQLAQHLQVPCWISDAVGRIAWVNDAWLDYTGASVEKIHAEGLRALHDPSLYGGVVRKWEQVKAAGAADEMIFPLKARDGSFRLFRTRVTPVRDAQGRITRWFGTNTDISAQTETEAKLRASQEQWREVFERAGDAIFITDADGRFLDVNDAACAMTQLARDELLARSVADVIEPDEHGAHPSAGRRDDPVSDWRIRRRDGGWVEAEVSSRRLSDGRRLGVARDVSRRRLAEQAEKQALTSEARAQQARAADAERHLHRFWDASRDLFAVVSSTDGVPRLVNERAWEATLGYPAEKITSTRLMELVHPDDRAPTMAMRVAHLDDRAYFGFENRYLRSDGGVVWLSWNVVREGDLIYCSARDTTNERRTHQELAQASERLAHAQKMETIGRLTGGVAHDFNNLLMVMAGHAELLLGRMREDATAVRSATAISEAARRGQALTRHLLAFSRRQRLKPAAVSLFSRISHLQPLLSSSLGGSVALEIDCQPDLWTVKVDVDEWELALLNMAVNARDAMPKGGRLTIVARNVCLGVTDHEEDLPGDFVEVVITDTGEGIAPDILPKVTDPFFTTKEVNKGTGLGLSQVDGFVQQSGGRMRIESVLGEGTRIRIYLPRAACAPAPEDQPSQPPAHRRLNILCVEDNVEVAEVTASLLEQLGHEAQIVSSAGAAMDRLEGGLRPDLLLTDIVMAGELNGLGLARAVRERWPRVPVLLVTGYSREAEAIGTEWPVLAKPFQSAALASALLSAARQTQVEA